MLINFAFVYNEGNFHIIHFYFGYNENKVLNHLREKIYFNFFNSSGTLIRTTDSNINNYHSNIIKENLEESENYALLAEDPVGTKNLKIKTLNI